MIREKAVPGPHYEALIELLRTSETLWNASRVFFARWDLSPSQFNVLNLLSSMENGCSQTELSRQLIMHRSNVTGLVDRLEARGLVQRLENLADRRSFSVILTGKGRILLDEIHPFYHAAAESLWGEIPPQRAKRLVAELRAVSTNAEKIVSRDWPNPAPANQVRVSKKRRTTRPNLPES